MILITSSYQQLKQLFHRALDIKLTIQTLSLLHSYINSNRAGIAINQNIVIVNNN